MSDMLNEIENRLRTIIREEIINAISVLDSLPNKSKETVSMDRLDRNSDLPKLLTAAEVAEFLGVKVSRVYQLARQRKQNGFPVTIIGERSMRFSYQLLNKWLLERSSIEN